MKVKVLIESWLTDGGGFKPVGVWYQPQGGAVDFWFIPAFDRLVADKPQLGTYSQQLANHFAASGTNLHNPALLEYWSEQGGQRIDRAGPYEIEVEELKPEELMAEVKKQIAA